MYKYFFYKDGMDIERMREATKLFLGKHDFRNFCKVAVTQVSNFIRTIVCVDIEQVNTCPWSVNGEDDMYAFTFHADGFLWHQIRCMVHVLFVIGRGHEDMSVITDLLDIAKSPERPSYPYASEKPLVLYNCTYDDVVF